MATWHEAQQQPSGKRKRVRLACVSCRVRKQRCDGAQPICSYCKQHDLECLFEPASKKADVSELYVHKILNRVTRLEDELERTRASLPPGNSTSSDIAPAGSSPSSPVKDVTARFSHLRQSSSSTSPADAISNLHAEQQILGLDWTISDAIDDGLDNVVPVIDGTSDQESSGESRLGKTTTMTFMKNIMGEPELESRSGAQSDKGIVDSARFDVQFHTWPQRFVADRLVDCFVEFCLPQYPFIHGPSFRKRYEILWSANEPLSNSFAGTVNMVFALGCNFSGEMPSTLGQRFFHRAKSLIEPTILQAATLDSLQALILLGLYLQSTDSLTRSWNVVGMAVNVAQTLALHKNDAYKESMSPLQQETRKRAWWACYLLDTISCMQLGRPHMIPDEQITVDLPACVDDEFLMDSTPPADQPQYQSPGVQPPSRPSLVSFFVATIQLCQFMREVHRAYEQPSDQTQILDIDQRMCDWAGDLPSHLQPNGESSPDPKLWRQKEVLTSRFLHLRLLLHRPAIAQRYSSNIPALTPFSSAKPAAMAQILSLRADACVGLAVSLINHISAFYAHGLNSAWWYDLNYLFSAATVLVVHSSSGLIEAHIIQTIQTAMFLIRGMRDRGKTLAGSYLKMLERFYQRILPGVQNMDTLPLTYQDPRMPPLESLPNPGVQQIPESSQNWADTSGINTYLENMTFPWTFRDEDFSDGNN